MIARLHRFKPRKTRRDVDAALRHLVRHARERVPFHRGLDAEGFRGADDLPRLPLAAKAEMLADFPAGVLARGLRPEDCQTRITSGSTGVPFVVFYRRAERFFRTLGFLRALSRHASLRPPVCMTELGYGAHALSDSLLPGARPATRPAPRWRPFSVSRIPRLAPVGDQVRLLREFRPDILTGHTSLLRLAAEEVLRTGPLEQSPRLLVSRGEALSPAVRSLLAEAFGGPVADFFNCEEVGNVAWQCPHAPDRMHVNHDLCWVEVIGPDGTPAPDGDPGRLAVTSLYNWTMPFIRYLLGDVAAVTGRGRCACGYEGTTLSLVQGREEDFLVLPGGLRVSPRAADILVTKALLGEGGAGGAPMRIPPMRYRMIQEQPLFFRILLQAPSAPDAALLQALRKAVATLHPAAECRVDPVAEIPLDPSGKGRTVLSTVRPPAGHAHPF